MPDGKRRRRHSEDQAKRLWYARYRSFRFGRRFGSGAVRTMDFPFASLPQLAATTAVAG